MALPDIVWEDSVASFTNNKEGDIPSLHCYFRLATCVFLKQHYPNMKAGYLHLDTLFSLSYIFEIRLLTNGLS